jgi:hypothetical protein
VTSIEDYYPFIYSTYFPSSFDARDQLDRLFPERKSALIEYFAEIQARLLPLNAGQTRDRKQLDEHRQVIEKLVNKTEYLRLIKQKMTKIVLCLLLTYWNNDDNDSFDPWKPEAIAPAYSWLILRKTFDHLQ